jgi:hypothetical protein
MFVKRQIEVVFIDQKSNKDNTVTLEGHRCDCVVSNAGMMNGSMLELRIFGMSLASMSKYSSTGTMINTGNANREIGVVVLAGDEGKVLGQIFTGDVISAYMDFASVPDVSFVISATEGFNTQLLIAPPQSFKGSSDVGEMLKAIATNAGFKFLNYGVSKTLTDHYSSGSAIDQINAICKAAKIPKKIEDGVFSIWNNDSGIDQGAITAINAESGLVGYPSFDKAGLIIKTLFNPNITQGAKIKLTSVIPPANGTFDIYGVSHHLSTVSVSGSWFTEIYLNGQAGVNQDRYVSTI